MDESNIASSLAIDVTLTKTQTIKNDVRSNNVELLDCAVHRYVRAFA